MEALITTKRPLAHHTHPNLLVITVDPLFDLFLHLIETVSGCSLNTEQGLTNPYGNLVLRLGLVIF